MDNLTHSLFGLTLARTPLGRTGRGAAVALLLASNAPDIDIVATAGGAAKYLEWHRGPTHGPLGIVGLGLVVAAIVHFGLRSVRARRGGTRDGDGSLWSLWLISIVGVLCHILMDLPTSYGTRPLSPFVWTWFTVDWLPIVDVYLLGILGAGLWFGRKQPAQSAAIALTLMVAFYGLRATTHHLALVRAPEVFGAALPERCPGAVPPGGAVDWWPRPALESPREAQSQRCLVEIAAMPDMLSPFQWRLLAQMTDAYETRDVDLLDAFSPEPDAGTIRRVSVRYPNQWTPAVMTAAPSRVARIFLGFSRFPAARSVREADGKTVVRWSDMRFASGTPRNGQRGSNLFSAVVEVSPEGLILSQRLGP